MFVKRLLAPAIAASFAGIVAASAGTNDTAPEKTEAAETEAAETEAAETEAAETEPAVEAVPEFTEAFLSDPERIAGGQEIWQEQCRHCHGRSAYPGKAPKLRPRRYTPDFVYDRVTNGFRKMPAWDEVYSQEERMDVVAYILSKQFAP